MLIWEIKIENLPHLDNPSLLSYKIYIYIYIFLQGSGFRKDWLKLKVKIFYEEPINRKSILWIILF